MAEVFSWPEASIFLFPAGSTTGILTFGQNLRLAAEADHHRVLSMATGAPAARTRFNLIDRTYTLSVGMLYANQSAFFVANSATSYNALIQFDVGHGYDYLLLQDGFYLLQETGGGKLILEGQYAGASLALWSAVFSDFALVGQTNGLWQTPLQMRAPAISGV